MATKREVYIALSEISNRLDAITAEIHMAPDDNGPFSPSGTGPLGALGALEGPGVAILDIKRNADDILQRLARLSECVRNSHHKTSGV